MVGAETRAGFSDFAGEPELLVNIEGCDYSGKNLTSDVLSGVRARGANFAGAAFGRESSRADFRGADMRGATFRSTNLYQTDMRGADLRNADFEGARTTPPSGDKMTAGLCLHWASGKEQTQHTLLYLRSRTGAVSFRHLHYREMIADGHTLSAYQRVQSRR